MQKQHNCTLLDPLVKYFNNLPANILLGIGKRSLRFATASINIHNNAENILTNGVDLLAQTTHDISSQRRNNSENQPNPSPNGKNVDFVKLGCTLLVQTDAVSRKLDVLLKKDLKASIMHLQIAENALNMYHNCSPKDSETNWKQFTQEINQAHSKIINAIGTVKDLHNKLNAYCIRIITEFFKFSNYGKNVQNGIKQIFNILRQIQNDQELISMIKNLLTSRQNKLWLPQKAEQEFLALCLFSIKVEELISFLIDITITYVTFENKNKNKGSNGKKFNMSQMHHEAKDEEDEKIFEENSWIPAKGNYNNDNVQQDHIHHYVNKDKDKNRNENDAHLKLQDVFAKFGLLSKDGNSINKEDIVSMLNRERSMLPNVFESRFLGGKRIFKNDIFQFDRICKLFNLSITKEMKKYASVVNNNHNNNNNNNSSDDNGSNHLTRAKGVIMNCNKEIKKSWEKELEFWKLNILFQHGIRTDVILSSYNYKSIFNSITLEFDKSVIKNTKIDVKGISPFFTLRDVLKNARNIDSGDSLISDLIDNTLQDEKHCILEIYKENEQSENKGKVNNNNIDNGAILHYDVQQFDRTLFDLRVMNKSRITVFNNCPKQKSCCDKIFEMFS